MYPSRPEINVGLAYLLWGLGCFGICGIHRFYLGKPVSGLIWLFTFGLFGFGQFIDLFLIPGLSQERNRYLWERSRTDSLLNTAAMGQQTIPTDVTMTDIPKRIEGNPDPMLKLLKAAAANNNILSVGQAMIATELSHDEIESLLKKALRQGIAHVDNDPKSGGVRYYFDL
ncbi:TM2 domain-containing protein [Candidatus Gracilibacteria bacterium]|jgi:TM2 domain-containing membrane protein YozV|nr:TM2 domain-containing protein [Candidatus Gracilibacteria bacterium]NJM88113.1 TM2 domain-containing protein [Hydrococcus sp. RU_2_2]NJP18524.1 TM2 domain-containing protein [Hydrococcus sp. CRU_1_1]